MEICGREINIGDHVKVQYTTGRQFKGAVLTGKVTKLWDADGDEYPVAPVKQGQVDNGWCFHDHDKILEHFTK